jgi:hypothetical protein
LSARRDCAGGSRIDLGRRNALLTAIPAPRTRSGPHCAGALNAIRVNCEKDNDCTR